uniref:rRNA intron-encoded endonuclease n=1 Tax=Thermoproteus sp. IC-061 TaxID=70773 RepID=Q6L6Z5_9CREN|nr:rRNA intron-encoded endonuclease [Thermoproteus sp. IC-061]
MSVAYLLGLIVGDGGLYALRYRGGRTEYRVVITQKDEGVVEKAVVMLEALLRELGLKSRVQVIRGRSRTEVRVSSKALWQFFNNVLSNLEGFQPSERAAFIEGLYDAEGDKSGRRARIWNKNLQLLELVKNWLSEFGIESTIYLDDKRHGVYVLEVPSPYRDRFFKLIHPPQPPDSSGVHEWINEVPTVPARGPANPPPGAQSWDPRRGEKSLWSFTAACRCGGAGDAERRQEQ